MTRLALRTDHPELADMFAWAAETAAGHVVRAGEVGPLDVDEDRLEGDGTAEYAASYRAGYGHRSGYYLRDFCHQAVGAHLLGLRAENAQMLASFVDSAADGWPAWALNFDARTPLAIDVRPDGRRVRELPAVFELVETVQSLHRWTGDPVAAATAAFAVRTVTEFVSAHDAERPNGIAEAGGPSIFDGVASYDESPEVRLFESGDGIGAQYAATLHAAALLRSAGADDAAARLDGIAGRILQLYREEWGRGPGDTVVSGWTREGAPAVGWHREATWFPPLKGLLHQDLRLRAELDRIDALCGDPETAPRNVESLTYLPDMYVRNGDAERAFAWMRRIYGRRGRPHPVAQQGTDGSYPEVAFTLVAQCTAGLLGLEPDASIGRLTIAPRPPRSVTRLEVDGIPFGDGEIDVAWGPNGMRVRNRTSRPLEVQLVGRRPRMFRDPHLTGRAPAAAATQADASPGEEVALSRARARSSSGSAAPAR